MIETSTVTSADVDEFCTSSRTEPIPGSQNLRKRLAIVVLPAPDGPTSATVLPRGTVNETSVSAGRRRPG